MKAFSHPFTAKEGWIKNKNTCTVYTEDLKIDLIDKLMHFLTCKSLVIWEGKPGDGLHIKALM